MAIRRNARHNVFSIVSGVRYRASQTPLTPTPERRIRDGPETTIKVEYDALFEARYFVVGDLLSLCVGCPGGFRLGPAPEPDEG